MKTTAILLLIPALLFAQGQDSAAAELFYRAFWLETAAGEYAKANLLYRAVVDKYENAPEAARAALGMARVQAAQGRDIASIVKLLETKFPNAKAEIRTARRIAAARLRPFNPTITVSDSPIIQKIKICYKLMLKMNCAQPDRQLLVESGPLAHSMLSALLRTPNYDPVLRASTVLVAQKTAKAYTVLERALGDKQVLYKTAIVHSMRDITIDSAGIATALSRVYRTGSPTMKSSIVSTMTRLTRVEGETRKIAYALLTEALSSKIDGVRKDALNPYYKSYDEWPDAYLNARLDRMEKNDPVVSSSAYAGLLHLVDRREVYDRTLKIYRGRPLSTSIPRYSSMSARGAEIVARTVIEKLAKGSAKQTVYQCASQAARWAPSAAIIMLDNAVERGDKMLAEYVRSGIARRIGRHRSADAGKQVRIYLGKHADPLANRALSACFAAQAKKRDAGSYVAKMVGLGPKGDELLVAAIQANPKKPLPEIVFHSGTMVAFGPARMAKVAVLARTERDHDRFLSAGVIYTRSSKYPKRGYEFFKVVVPNVSEKAMHSLKRVAERTVQNRTLVATKLIRSPTWDWKNSHSPSALHVWTASNMVPACATPSLLPLTFTLTADRRYRIAQTALHVAAQEKSEGALKALVLGLNAPTIQLRKFAQGSLAQRGEPGLTALVRNLKWEATGEVERNYALALLSASKAQPHADFVRGKLASRKNRWAPAWKTYQSITPKRATELALVEALGPGETRFRLEALRTLTRTSDARRIPVFEKVLKEGDIASVYVVVQTVSDQYLIELGSLVLQKLRSPDRRIRKAATTAIERLKFYADAQETFPPAGGK